MASDLVSEESASPVRVVTMTALESIVRGEVDVQIRSAHMYPRNLRQSIDRAMALAMTDEEIAGECMYALSRSGKRIEGGSARLAEILTHSWGNMRCASRVVSIDARTITAQAVAHDLETNNLRMAECTRRITRKDGSRYDDDMIAVTANAAASIAARNAVFSVIPKAVWWPIYLAAKDVALGKAEALVDKRAKMLDFFSKMGIATAQVLSAVERSRIEDVTRDDLATLKGLAAAIKSGETTIDEAFPNGATDSRSTPSGDKGKSKASKLAADLKRRTPEPEPQPADDVPDAPAAGEDAPPPISTPSPGRKPTAAKSDAPPIDSKRASRLYNRISAADKDIRDVIFSEHNMTAVSLHKQCHSLTEAQADAIEEMLEGGVTVNEH